MRGPVRFSGSLLVCRGGGSANSDFPVRIVCGRSASAGDRPNGSLVWLAFVLGLTWPFL